MKCHLTLAVFIDHAVAAAIAGGFVGIEAVQHGIADGVKGGYYGVSLSHTWKNKPPFHTLAP